jgi:hypothetical protein
MTYFEDFLGRIELIAKATGAVLNGLSTGASVPARDVAAVLILVPLAIWILILLARPSGSPSRRTRRTARR